MCFGPTLRDGSRARLGALRASVADQSQSRAEGGPIGPRRTPRRRAERPTRPRLVLPDQARSPPRNRVGSSPGRPRVWEKGSEIVHGRLCPQETDHRKRPLYGRDPDKTTATRSARNPRPRRGSSGGSPGCGRGSWRKSDFSHFPRTRPAHSLRCTLKFVTLAGGGQFSSRQSDQGRYEIASRL